MKVEKKKSKKHFSIVKKDSFDLITPLNGYRETPGVPGPHFEDCCSRSFFRHIDLRLRIKKAFRLKNNHHPVVGGDVSLTIGSNRSAIWHPLEWSRLAGGHSGLTHRCWASQVRCGGGVGLSSQMTAAAPTGWASPLPTAVSRRAKPSCCATCFQKSSLRNLRGLIALLTPVFKRAVFTGFKKIPNRYN